LVKNVVKIIEPKGSFFNEKIPTLKIMNLKSLKRKAWFLMENIKLYHGDCLDVMYKLIEQGIKVDMILTDPPYGTTQCKWDVVIPFDDMWERLNKLIKPNGAIVLFGSEPFSSALRMSNIKNYKYDWVWNKCRGTDFLNSKRKPLSSYENISVFYLKQPTYNPQFWFSTPYNKGLVKQSTMECYGKTNDVISRSEDGRRYPLNIININKLNGHKKNFHPTQKPVDLLEYLIKTYTNENETVLDFTMGSGSTGIACANTNRKFIGIELDEKYFEIAKKRIEESLE
jgi:site-specific DNA-methyltransferase (adenine-specific)